MNRINRRVFLKYLGAAAGALAVPSAASTVFASDQDVLRAGRSLGARIGVMVPESKEYPLMAERFLAGLGLHFEGSKVAIIRENIGASLPVSSLRKLVEGEGADIVVGLMNSGAASSLVRLMPEEKTVFIASNVGEVMPRSGEQAPNLFHATLNYWQAGWAMGRWAAANLGRKACIASSLHDSGYDALYAFRLGFESSGGRISGTFVTHSKEQVSGAVSELVRIRPDFVYTAYSGPDAVEFIKAYSNSAIGGNVPLAGSAFLLDTADTSKFREVPDHIKICSPFGPTAEREAFNRAYRKKTGSSSDVFSLLGYETARCISAALEASGGNASRKDVLIRSMETVSFEGIRGRIEMDPASHATSGPLYLGDMRLDGLAGTKILGRGLSISGHDTRVKSLHTTVRSGWNNSYLCA
jgi:branched-chain amino acid transport system substrate-binding protein